jgi:hypothetical protein
MTLLITTKGGMMDLSRALVEIYINILEKAKHVDKERANKLRDIADVQEVERMVNHGADERAGRELRDE